LVNFLFLQSHPLLLLVNSLIVYVLLPTFLYVPWALGLVYTMQEIGPRSWTERGLTNRIDQVTELLKCDLLILSPFKILDQFLASCTQGLSIPAALSTRPHLLIAFHSYGLYNMKYTIYTKTLHKQWFRKLLALAKIDLLWSSGKGI